MRSAPALDTREWLLTNGLGGYASGTVSGVRTRRYHGLLIAAHAPPLGRVLTLTGLEATLEPGDDPVLLEAHETPGGVTPGGARLSFRLEDGLSIWRYEARGRALERRIVLRHGHNTTSVEYRLVEGDPIGLELRPLLELRGHDTPVGGAHPVAELAIGEGGLDVLTEDWPALRLRYPEAATFIEDRAELPRWYRLESARGYAAEGTVVALGRLRWTLGPDAPLRFLLSTEADAGDPDHAALEEEERQRRLALVAAAGVEPDRTTARLIHAADQFIFVPPGRTVGTGARSVIAGYHWFTDWGRDTMIALEGLTLATGLPGEAAAILRTFARHVRDGLIPNLFPESDDEGLYHTADATLWYFHALHRYLGRTGDAALLRELLPTLRRIVDRHVEGTRFGIGMDPEDGLLRQGAEGYQLTWMDAKVDGWVVTPRRGKAVEINALWYNALRLMQGWLRPHDDDGADRLHHLADRVHASFNRRFWYDEGGWLYDVVDGESGDDPALRPNQLFAIALDHPVLDRERWKPVVDRVEARLLTPVGLRSLDPDHPDYHPRYDGDLRARDAAYHQGTVWGWLIGPFIDAWLRAHPGEEARARRFLEGLIEHLDDGGLGTLSEIFDAEPPHTPRGCIAQAWTVAEVLRQSQDLGFGI